MLTSSDVLVKGFHQYISDGMSLCQSSKKYPRRDLTVQVDISKLEVSRIFTAAIKSVEAEYSNRQFDYYKIYLKHLLGETSDSIDISAILQKLENLKKTVDFRIDCTEFSDDCFVTNLLMRNEYISKSIKRSGVTVKLFHTYHEDRDVMVKTYVYDGECASLDDRMMACFKDEVLFQYYAANNLSKRDFISPDLYSWGSIRKYKFIGDKYLYKCLFLIMEYIPGLTLNQATYTTETMKTMYERVKIIDKKMISIGIHHNDLHGRNVIIPQKSPLPEVVILDFGEASFGPRKPLFR